MPKIESHLKHNPLEYLRTHASFPSFFEKVIKNIKITGLAFCLLGLNLACVPAASSSSTASIQAEPTLTSEDEYARFNLFVPAATALLSVGSHNEPTFIMQTDDGDFEAITIDKIEGEVNHSTLQLKIPRVGTYFPFQDSKFKVESSPGISAHSSITHMPFSSEANDEFKKLVISRRFLPLKRSLPPELYDELLLIEEGKAGRGVASRVSIMGFQPGNIMGVLDPYYGSDSCRLGTGRPVVKSNHGATPYVVGVMSSSTNQLPGNQCAIDIIPFRIGK